jgi:phage baseplate assembly protein V
MIDLRSLQRRVGGLVQRGIVKAVDEQHGTRRVQVLTADGQVTPFLEHLDAFGLTGRPLPGAEAVVFQVGGLSDHRVVLTAADARYRPTSLGQGDVALWDAYGHSLTISGTSATLTHTDIRLGSSAATTALALWTTAFSSWLSNHKHTGGTLGGGLTGPVDVSTPAPNAAATKVTGE